LTEPGTPPDTKNRNRFDLMLQHGQFSLK
jgi:hypothetical protein